MVVAATITRDDSETEGVESNPYIVQLETRVVYKLRFGVEGVGECAEEGIYQTTESIREDHRPVVIQANLHAIEVKCPHNQTKSNQVRPNVDSLVVDLEDADEVVEPWHVFFTETRH